MSENILQSTKLYPTLSGRGQMFWVMIFEIAHTTASR